LALFEHFIFSVSATLAVESTSHFIRSFKGHFRITPSQYKKQLAKRTIQTDAANRPPIAVDLP
jgi:AraC-like DNA-binding protein